MNSFVGFRALLERATRVDDDNDWSVHTIDYQGFKKRLLHFTRRRSKLRNLLRESTDGCITVQQLREFLGPTPDAHAAAILANLRQNSTVKVTNTGLGSGGPGTWSPSNVNNNSSTNFFTNYVPFLDASDSSAAPPETTTSRASSSFFPETMTGDSLYEEAMHRRLKRRTIMRKVSNAERDELIVFLSNEMDKVTMFYLAQWQKLSQKLVDEPSNYVMLGDEILELYAYCTINIVTVRQVLIRYDAFARAYEGTPMLHYFMKQVSNNPTSFRKLLYHEEVIAMAEHFGEVVAEEKQFPLWTKFQRQRQAFDHVLESSERAEALASTGHFAITDTLLQTLRYYFLLGLVEDRLGYEPSYLTSRGKSLTEEMSQMAKWRLLQRQQQAAKIAESVKAMSPPKPESLSAGQTLNLIMALVAGFLYCMNYYIVEPSSTMYVNALGAHDAMSGTLIGMMPLASFTSAIFYSLWTNHSFRHPFMFSCLLLLTGNILYSAAFNFRSIEMALVGRFLTGLGGPKCIIRRYMADTTTVSLRTSVNAGFGMVVAAGSALGPGCAILLNKWDYVIRVPRGAIWLNGMTGPGYFMASLWLVFTIILVATFKEPPRLGLEEQKRLEQVAVMSGDEVIGGDINHVLSPNKSATEDNEGQKPSSHGWSTPPPSSPRVDKNNDDNNNNNHVDYSSGLDFSTSVASSHHGATIELVGTNNVINQKLLGSETTRDDEVLTVFSGATNSDDVTNPYIRSANSFTSSSVPQWIQDIRRFFVLVTFPVRLCLGMLFVKVFVIESLVSSTSALTKNRYGWEVKQVGTLGCVNGFMVIPLSIMVGRLSMSYQDRLLMLWLLFIGTCGLLCLIDLSDLFYGTPSDTYNDDHWLAVHPKRYVTGYFLVYVSIQSFEGVIGSALSKVIPTALASGTFNSGLLATLVDTFGRACGDLFISFVGFIDIRQLMNLLFVPGVILLMTCSIVVRRYYDVLAV